MSEQAEFHDQESEIPRMSRRGRRLLLTELGMVVVAVLVFLGFLTILTRVYFPTGGGLSVGEESWRQDRQRDVGNLVLNAGENQETEFFTGEIIQVSRKVQKRAKDSLIWNTADTGDQLQKRDAVQTLARSTAVIRINKKSELRVGEKSLIVFESSDRDVFLAASGSLMLMVKGELSGRISSEDQRRFRFAVNLPNGGVVLRPNESAGTAEFRMTINEDRSSTLNVYQGNAQFRRSDGTLIRISKDQGVTVSTDGTMSELFTLPDAPVAGGPGDGTSIVVGPLPETVRFSWSDVKNVDGYRILISRDPKFADMVVDDDVLETSFSHDNLSEGDYFWTVRSRKGYVQGLGTDVQTFRVIRDLSPPQLFVQEPPEQPLDNAWVLRGRTERNAEVFVNGDPIKVSAGEFSETVVLKPGANVIVVESVDSVGNVAYASRVAYAR